MVGVQNMQDGPTGWVAKHIRTNSKMHKGIKAEDKVQFFQQLTTLFQAGTPLLEALYIASNQTQSIKMQSVIRAIADQVASGASLNQAMGDFPKIFDRQWIEVVRTGELSGQLADVLTSLTSYIVSVREIRAKIVSAMTYPTILIIVAILAVVVMLWKVVPTFASFFDDFGAELPAITQGVIDLSEYIQEKGLMMFGIIIAGVLVLRTYLRSSGGQRVAGQLIVTAPLLGDVAIQAYMERFATNMVLLIKSGLPLLEALQSMQGVFHKSVVYRESLARIESRVASGVPLATAMEDSGVFTSMMISMVRVGEESGRLDTVLAEVASYYKGKV
jgi:type IV pilus assembly protein PilC